MHHISASISSRRFQLGISFLELLTVVSIIGIIAFAAAPHFKEMIERQNLNNAKSALFHSLNKAKNIARTESTVVTVSLTGNVITLTPGNSANTHTTTLPDTINIDSFTSFQFNAMGMATTTAGNNLDSDMSINLHPNSNEDREETVKITPTGLIAQL